MLKASVNNNEFFTIREEDDQLFLNDTLFEWDIHRRDKRHFHIIHKHKSYNAEIVDIDMEAKIFKLKIEGRLYDVEIKDKVDLLLEKLGLSTKASSLLTEIKAPMPGLIIHIYIEEGMMVKKGEPLAILEAMKMENIIKSPGEGTVKKIVTQKGDSVEKGQVLITFA